MNINISLDIPGIKDIDGDTVNVSISENISLNPFYASIHDIELYFGEDVKFTDSFIDKLGEIIFNKSIYIDSFLRNKTLCLSDEDIYIIKRDYVICASVYEASKHIYINTAKSTSVKKQLGDFLVERSVTNDLSKINSIGDDAKSCMDDIIDELKSLTNIIAESFVKGSIFGKNRRSDRLWHHPDYLSIVPIGVDKLLESDGRFYKTGVAHAYQYKSI